MSSDETLFTAHPAEELTNLIQYNPTFMDQHLISTGYADAARRLRASYSGQPWDDVMLLPFMFLWRQAIELELKTTIRGLTALRRRDGDTDPQLQPAVVDERLRNPRKVGHNLTKLMRELSRHVKALDLEPIPQPHVKTIELLAALDNGGTGFRYAGVLESSSADIDFQSLADALDEAFKLLEVVIDAATDGEGV